MNGDPDSYLCDYCSDLLSEDQDKIFYICIDSDNSRAITAINSMYCKSCGHKSLYLPSDSHLEALIYYPSNLKSKGLDKIISNLTNKTNFEKIDYVLDYSLVGEGYNWKFDEIARDMFPNRVFEQVSNQGSPHTKEWAASMRSPLKLIDMFNNFGYYDIKNLEKENQNIYLNQEEAECIQYLAEVFTETKNSRLFERELGLKTDFKKEHF